MYQALIWLAYIRKILFDNEYMTVSTLPRAKLIIIINGAGVYSCDCPQNTSQISIPKHTYCSTKKLHILDTFSPKVKTANWILARAQGKIVMRAGTVTEAVLAAWKPQSPHEAPGQYILQKHWFSCSDYATTRAVVVFFSVITMREFCHVIVWFCSACGVSESLTNATPGIKMIDYTGWRARKKKNDFIKSYEPESFRYLHYCWGCTRPWGLDLLS